MDQLPDTHHPTPASRARAVLPERRPFLGVPEVLQKFEKDNPFVRLLALGVCALISGWPYVASIVVGLVSLMAAWH